MKQQILFSLVAATVVLTGCNTETPVPDPAAKVNVTAAQYNVELGVGYLNTNQIERAKGKLLLALEQGPKYAPAYDAMGFFMEKTGQPEKANAYYQKALTLNNRAGDSLNNYGAYLCRQKHYSAAINQFMEAVADTKYLTPADAYENAGFCALAIPDKAAASDYFHKAVLQDPQHVASYLELANLAFNAHNYGETLNQLKNYYQMAQQYGPRSLWLKAQAEQHLGQRTQAHADIEQLKNLFPESPEAQLARRAAIS